jgi:hypothetical protein
LGKELWSALHSPFDLDNCDILNAVAPEDAAIFKDWPWFHLFRKLIPHEVFLLQIPMTELFGGSTFSCKFRDTDCHSGKSDAHQQEKYC